MSGETRMKFLIGDVWEEVVLFLAKLAGHKVEREQETIEIQNVSGHIDGFIDDDLVDVKSASPYSFQKFKDGLTQENDSFGYLRQLGLYKHVTRAKRAFFLVADKTLGKLHLAPLQEDNVDYEALVSQKKEIVAADTPPPRRYEDIPDGASGNRKLQTVCEYCEFKSWCWKNLRGFAYSGKPRFLTVVKREPDVPEFLV